MSLLDDNLFLDVGVKCECEGLCMYSVYVCMCVDMYMYMYARICIHVYTYTTCILGEFHLYCHCFSLNSFVFTAIRRKCSKN